MIVVSDFLPLGDDLVCRWARMAEERVCDEGEDCADEDCDEDAVHFERETPPREMSAARFWLCAFEARGVQLRLRQLR